MVSSKILVVTIIITLTIITPYLYKFYIQEFTSIEKYGILFRFRKPYIEALGIKVNHDLSKLFLNKNLSKIYLFIVNESEWQNLTAIGYFDIVNKLTMFYNLNNYTLTLSPKIVEKYEDLTKYKIEENEVGIVFVDPRNSERTEIFVKNNLVFLKYKNKNDFDKVLIKFIISALKLI
ncbi:MAG: hypothetical protein RMJ17_04210 [Candidatus Aenigmarchaeota archaeon]|nr:hypothetical protein [Candidatus Aenigmarchaeota archaeon]MDW8149761.1 hypothetical protein [Candidatus Aenigmarchaeota archaeon]